MKKIFSLILVLVLGVVTCSLTSCGNPSPNPNTKLGKQRRTDFYYWNHVVAREEEQERSHPLQPPYKVAYVTFQVGPIEKYHEWDKDFDKWQVGVAIRCRGVRWFAVISEVVPVVDGFSVSFDDGTITKISEQEMRNLCSMEQRQLAPGDTMRFSWKYPIND